MRVFGTVGLAFALGFAVSWITTTRGSDCPNGGAGRLRCVPLDELTPGTHFTIAHSTPGGCHESHQLVIMRVIPKDGPEEGEDQNLGPREEWRFHFPGKVCYAVPR
jgi:hypothetical protein